MDAATTAQPPPSATAPPATALPDQIELPRLVDLCAQRLQTPIDYDSKVLVGTVTLRWGDVGAKPDDPGRGGVTDAELWSLTNQLLASRGFTTIRQAGTERGISVVKIEQAAGLARVEDLSELDPDRAAADQPVADARTLDPGFRTVIVRAKNRSARDVIDGLKAVLSKTGSAAAEIPGASVRGSAVSPQGAAAAGAVEGQSAGGLILLSDLSPRVEQALALLARLDTFIEGGVVEEVSLVHLSAGQAIGLATSVAVRRESVAGRKPIGELMASPSGNAVLVIAPADRLAYWREIIGQLDQREGVATVNYTPRHFALKDVANLIQETLAGGTRGSGAGAGSALIGASPRGGPPGGAAASNVFAAADDRFRMIVDDLTGTLIITATASQHERIADLMARLDAVPPAARRPMRSYVLKNRPVKEVVGVLSSMLAAGVLEGAGDASEPGSRESGIADPGGFGAAGAVMPGDPYAPGVAPTLPARSTQPGATRREGGEGEESAGTARRAGARPDGGVAGDGAFAAPALSLTSDDATNTLIAVGEPRLLAQLESLLVALDVRQPQVMLDVLLLSLTDSQTLALGIELDKITRAGDTQIRLSSLFGISTTSAATPSTAAGGAGGTVTVLSPAEFSIVIKALETLNEGRSLSVPRLLVSNNQKGDFTSNLQQPVQTNTTVNQTTTQGFAGYEQAGTTVSVQPRITEADHLLLQYNVTLSSFVGSGSSGIPPPRQENRLTSQVAIPDGYTVALGGIELTTTGEQTSQVPFLSAIPIIGEAFKSRSNSGSRSRFFVFIRAEVMRNTTFEDLKYASDLATTDAGIGDGFPVVNPQVMR